MFGNYITYRSPNTELTVADIFREHWDDYRQQYPVTPQQAKVVGAIMACRTPRLGGRIDQCNECGAWCSGTTIAAGIGIATNATQSGMSEPNGWRSRG